MLVCLLMEGGHGVPVRDGRHPRQRGDLPHHRGEGRVRTKFEETRLFTREEGDDDLNTLLTRILSQGSVSKGQRRLKEVQSAFLS
jgi:hypothetical protein